MTFLEILPLLMFGALALFIFTGYPVAFVLGGGNLLKIHLKKVSDQSEGWGYSGVILICFITTLVVGLGKLGAYPNPDFPNVRLSGETQSSGGFWWAYEYVFKPLTATMFSMLAFATGMRLVPIIVPW